MLMKVFTATLLVMMAACKTTEPVLEWDGDPPPAYFERAFKEEGPWTRVTATPKCTTAATTCRYSTQLPPSVKRGDRIYVRQCVDKECSAPTSVVYK